jgi:hypothetical protein
MGSPQHNETPVPVSPSFWLATLSRQLRRAAVRTRALEAEAGSTRDKARRWLRDNTDRTRARAGIVANRVGTACAPVADETKRGLGLLRRRFRHTAALVSIPWLKVGEGMASLVVLGFLLFQPRGEAGQPMKGREQAVAQREVRSGAATTPLIAPVAQSTKSCLTNSE